MMHKRVPIPGLPQWELQDYVSMIVHFLPGLWAGFWLCVIPWAGWRMIDLFLVYELNEEANLKDGAYRDIRGFELGVNLGPLVAAAWWIWLLVKLGRL